MSRAPTSVSSSSSSFSSSSSSGARNEPSSSDQNLESFRHELQRLIDTFSQFSNSGSIRDGFFLSDMLLEYASRTNLESHKKVVAQIGETYKNIENSRRQFLESITSTIVSPLSDFIRVDLEEATAMKARVGTAKEEFENAQLRFDVARTSGKSGKNAITTTTKELEDSKKGLETAEAEYSSKMVDVHTKKEFEILERLCSYTFSLSNYFHEGQKKLAALEPLLRSTMESLVKAHSDYIEGRGQLDVDQILARQREVQPAKAAAIDLKQGYLAIKKKNAWNKRWFVVTDGVLYVYKNWKDLDPMEVVNLLLCTVKKLPGGLEKNNCFAVLSPTVNMTLQALDENDLDEWIQVIEQGIGQQLKKRQKEGTTQSNLVAAEEKFSYLRDLQAISPANKLCADCSADAPEWALMNMGVLICYECSGVHRSLGVHISKVRSLTLDQWDHELFNIIKSFGNKKGNQILEQTLHKQGVTKLRPESTRQEREEYIRAKYDQRKFIRPFPGDANQLNKSLYDAANEGDIFKAMEAIIQGAEVNYAVVPEEKRTLLHQLMIDGKTTTYVLELLIQNGASVYSMDSNGWTPLHFAAKHDRATYARILMLRGGAENSEDKQRNTPITIANSSNSKKVIRYFNNELKNEELIGLQETDLVHLQTIREAVGQNASVIRGKLELLKRQIKEASSVEEVEALLRQIRVVKLAVFSD